MTRFLARSSGADGSVREESVEALSPAAVASRLEQQGRTPLSIRAEAPAPAYGGGVKPEEIVFLTRQLRTLYRAGMPLSQALRVLGDQPSSARMGAVCDGLARDVESGASLSEAMARRPRVFPPLILHTVAAGERGGTLEMSLEHLAEMLEHEAETRANLKAAVRYPAFVTVTLAAAFLVMTLFVVPRFARLYERHRTALPWPTRAVMGINRAFVEYGWIVGPAILAAIVGTVVGSRTPAGRLRVDRLKLRAPVLRTIFLKTYLSRFAVLFGTLHRSGVPVPESLATVAGAVGSAVLQRELLRAREAVVRGEHLSDALRAAPIFPLLVVQTIAVAEKTGDIANMMALVAQHYDAEVRYALRNLTTAIEPILILMLGGMILFFALAIFLPIWDLMSLFRQ